MPRKTLIQKVKRIVVKVGTSTITDSGTISEKRIAAIVSDICFLMERGYQIALVSSGAIAAGAAVLSRRGNGLTIPQKQALAAIGQTILINEYRKHFFKHGVEVGQILLTEDDLTSRRRFLNARHTFNELLAMGVVPIVNENDSVVVKEIKVGDNDTLSAHVTSLIDADLLILLSDIDGFYWDLNDTEPVEEIHKVTKNMYLRAGDTSSDFGTGGMATKIRAADLIIRFGEMMVIASGMEKNILTRIMNGEKIGTIFVGKDKPLSSRKRWLSLKSARGTVSIDPGAVEAITSRKKSLLATGITGVDGVFDMGEIVELLDHEGRPVGKGIVNYNHEELTLIKGKKSGEIKDILGIDYFDEVINRDDLIVY